MVSSHSGEVLWEKIKKATNGNNNEAVFWRKLLKSGSVKVKVQSIFFSKIKNIGETTENF